MTPNEAISEAAARIGDAGFVNITREEYLTYLNSVAHEIWFRSKAAHVIRQYQLAEGEKKFTIPDKDIIRFNLMQMRFANSPAADGVANIYDQEETPLYLIEKAPQQDIEEDIGYYLDRGQLQENFHVWVEFHNGQYTLHSNIKFASGMILHVYAVVHSPRFAWIVAPSAVWPNTPTDNEVTADIAAGNLTSANAQLIWEPFRTVFVEGCLWRAAQQHMRYVKDQSVASIYRDTRAEYYRRYLPDVIHYIHSLKDGTSATIARTFHYLVKNRRGRLY